MKILRLSESTISQATANKYIDKRTSKEYFNLTHGLRGPSTWKWFAGVSPDYFDQHKDVLCFDNDNYALVPIYQKRKILVDGKGNTCYNIVVDNDPSNKNDILLLWSIPVRTCKKVKYSIHGSVDEIGCGLCGRSRGVNTVTIPAPILEIYGDCSFSWDGLLPSGESLTQKVSYDYATKRWDIGGIITLGDDDV